MNKTMMTVNLSIGNKSGWVTLGAIRRLAGVHDAVGLCVINVARDCGLAARDRRYQLSWRIKPT